MPRPIYDFKFVPEVAGWLVKDTENWRVFVVPMIFNHRVLLSTHEEWKTGWSAGWCYGSKDEAFLAAYVFDPENEMDPPGFKKLAADSRRTHREVYEVNERLRGYG